MDHRTFKGNFGDILFIWMSCMCPYCVPYARNRMGGLRSGATAAAARRFTDVPDRCRFLHTAILTSIGIELQNNTSQGVWTWR
jgi:hypothetical protein